MNEIVAVAPPGTCLEGARNALVDHAPEVEGDGKRRNLQPSKCATYSQRGIDLHTMARAKCRIIIVRLAFFGGFAQRTKATKQSVLCARFAGSVRFLRGARSPAAKVQRRRARPKCPLAPASHDVGQQENKRLEPRDLGELTQSQQFQRQKASKALLCLKCNTKLALWPCANLRKANSRHSEVCWLCKAQSQHSKASNNNNATFTPARAQGRAYHEQRLKRIVSKPVQRSGRTRKRSRPSFGI